MASLLFLHGMDVMSWNEGDSIQYKAGMLEKKYIEGLSTLMLYDLRHKNDFDLKRRTVLLQWYLGFYITEENS